MKNIFILLTSIFLSGSSTYLVCGLKSKSAIRRMDKLVVQKTDSLIKQKQTILLLQSRIQSLSQDAVIAKNQIEGLQNITLAQEQSIKAKDLALKNSREWQAIAIKTGIARVDTLWLNIFGNIAKRKNKK